MSRYFLMGHAGLKCCPVLAGSCVLVTEYTELLYVSCSDYGAYRNVVLITEHTEMLSCTGLMFWLWYILKCCPV